MASIVVLGSELRAGLITAALSRAGYSARCLSPELAHRSPGHTADALAIMLWPPGIHPAVEAEHHAGGSGALHAWWDGSFAEVGPFVTPGVGPCPLCLGARGPLPQPGHDPALAAWVAATHGILPSSALFCAETEKRHLATPDGVCVDGEGRVLLAEIKTTNKSWRTIPRTYLRQVWWQQHVLGAARTLFVWEEHDDFNPIHDEPKSVWIERDDREIGRLVGLATELIDELYRRTTGRDVRSRAPQHATPRRDQLRERDAFRALALAD